ncbi:MAG: methyltransferase domain-containing protein [Kineosporiaceae bacterium]
MAEETSRTRRWTVRSDPRFAVRTAGVWDTVSELLQAQAQRAGRDTLDVVDVGGGTGGFAVPVAGLGHRVTVVDPSPDALASLSRRAQDAGVSDLVRAEQGDAAGLPELLGRECADVVLCHGVLEYADDPHAALAGVVAALRGDGVASLLVAQRLGAVLANALAGRFAQARRLLDDPAGRGGEADPLPRRFDEASLAALLAPHGAAISDVHGVRLVTDLLPGALLDGDPAALDDLLALERAVAEHPTLSAVCAQLHVLVVPSRGAASGR